MQSANITTNLLRYLLSPAHEHAGGFGGVVVKEQAFAGVEGGDGGHVGFGEGEVEDVEVLLHPFNVGGLGDDYDSSLEKPAQSYLSHCLIVYAADFCKHRIGEEVVPAFGKRAPGHYACAEFLHDFLGFCLLVEDVGLHLVDGGNCLYIAGKVDEVVRVEVAYADSPQFAFFIGLFQCTVCAITVAERLVQEHEVYVVSLKPA